MKNFTWKTFAVIAVVLIALSMVYSNSVSNKANEGIELTSHVKGNTESAVTLTEYSDFECPACGQFYEVVNDVMDQYGSQIAFEYKHFPLVTIHTNAVPAAIAAEAAGQQGKFFEMHDKLFENQSVWASAPNPQSYFFKYAEELELDTDLFKTHLKASLLRDAVEGGFKESRDLGLTGTPSFFLNGERMQFETFADFTSQIESALGMSSDEEVVEKVEEGPKVEFGI